MRRTRALFFGVPIVGGCAAASDFSKEAAFTFTKRVVAEA